MFFASCCALAAAVPSAFLLSHTDYTNFTETASQGVLAAIPREKQLLGREGAEGAEGALFL